LAEREGADDASALLRVAATAGDTLAAKADGACPTQSAADRLLAFLESTTDCVVLLGRDWRLEFLNLRAAAEIGGRFADARPLGKTLWEAFPQLADSGFGDIYRAAMRDRTPATFEARDPDSDTWYESHIAPIDSGLAVCFRNITDRK